MKALSIVRTILAANSGVTAKRAGEIHINAAAQDDPLPNVVLMLVSGIEALTHQGPTGLIEDRVRIWCRAATPRRAAELAAAVDAALQGYVGTIAGARVQLIARAMSTSDYQDGAAVHRAILDFGVTWSLAPEEVEP